MCVGLLQLTFANHGNSNHLLSDIESYLTMNGYNSKSLVCASQEMYCMWTRGRPVNHFRFVELKTNAVEGESVRSVFGRRLKSCNVQKKRDGTFPSES